MTLSKAKRLTKPKIKTRSHYDYHECENYINKKYKIDIRNLANTKFNGKPDDPAYVDFWHSICDFAHNGGTVCLPEPEFMEGAHPLIVKTAELFEKEFPDADYSYWVSW